MNAVKIPIVHTFAWSSMPSRERDLLVLDVGLGEVEHEMIGEKLAAHQNGTPVMMVFPRAADNLTGDLEWEKGFDDRFISSQVPHYTTVDEDAKLLEESLEARGMTVVAHVEDGEHHIVILDQNHDFLAFVTGVSYPDTMSRAFMSARGFDLN